MISRHQFIEWLSFALTALIFCLLLSFRPVPSIASDNDTGRYVQRLHESCRGYELGEDIQNRGSSYWMFYAATSPACLVKSDSFFMFEVAAFLPLMFILFAKWGNGTFLWASSLLFSVTGLELMTNAMRQNFAMLLFFGAIALLQRHRAMALLLGVMAVVAHDSVVFYGPLLLWLAGVRISKRTLKVGGVVMLFMSLVFYSQLIELIHAADEMNTVYREIYVDESSTSFLLFMVLPLYWVYGLRYFQAKEYISGDERSCIVYSTGVMLIFYFAFPAIMYRTAIFAVALQIFLVTRSKTPSFVAGGYALTGSLVQLIVMLTVSNHYAVLIHG